MKIIKNILGSIFLAYALLVFAVTMMVVIVPIWLICKLPEPRRARIMHPLYRVWMNVYMPLIGCPVFRKGKQNFKKGEEYVVVLNHNALIDIPVSSPWIPGPNKTLAKIEMSQMPVFGIIYRSGSIIVDRKKESSRRESILKMQETLQMGIHLCLYPEGTRNKTGKPLQPFYDGAFITAVRAQKPVMPGLIFNTGKISPHNRKFWARPSPVHIHFLPPVPTIGLTLENVTELKEKVHKIMEDYYVANKDKV
jgi:1-acyl-sn-glycerol-3-phosphate acyltransferase